MNGDHGLRIRPGAEDDLPALRDIERAAGELFRDRDMDAVADDEPPTLAELRRYLRQDGLLVARERPCGPPVGYALWEPVDGCLHIEQLSVHPDRGRRGIGRELLEHLAGRAAAAGLPALTLTSFAEVPWNAPYYERCGFRRLSATETTPGLRRIRAREAAAGLDRWPRVCMRRDLGPGPETDGA